MSKLLVGKTLNCIQIAKDKEALRFQCAEGSYIVKAEGDCCSHTWIESIEAPAMGFPCLVTGIDDLDMGDDDYHDAEYGVIAHYGCKISTDKGDIVIDYRNESNGNYGGYLSWPRYEGFDEFDTSTLDWREVTFI